VAASLGKYVDVPRLRGHVFDPGEPGALKRNLTVVLGEISARRPSLRAKAAGLLEEMTGPAFPESVRVAAADVLENVDG
jgi:hypothetical protein